MATTLIEKETFISKAIDFTDAPPDTYEMWRALEPVINSFLDANTAAGDEKKSSRQMWYSRAQFGELILAVSARVRNEGRSEQPTTTSAPPKKATAAAPKGKELPDYTAFLGKLIDAQWDGNTYYAATLEKYDPTHVDAFGPTPFYVTWEDETVDWVGKIRQVGGAAIPKVEVPADAQPETSLADKLRESVEVEASAEKKKGKQPPIATAEMVKLAADAVRNRDAALKPAVTPNPAPTMKKGDRKPLVACSDAILMQVAERCGSTVPADAEKLSAAQRGSLLAELKEAGYTEVEWYSANTVGLVEPEAEEDEPTPVKKPSKKGGAKLAVVAPAPEAKKAKPAEKPSKGKGAPAPKEAPAKPADKPAKAKTPSKEAPAPKSGKSKKAAA